MNFFTFNSELIKKIFLGIIILIILFISSIYWFTRLYFTKTGDLLPIDKAAKFIITHGKTKLCYYNNLITSNTDGDLKFSLLNNIDSKPEITILGSSRVLEYFQPMFKRPFINMGRAIQYPWMVKKFIQNLDKNNNYPKIILFGLDFWWFNPNHILWKNREGFKLKKVKIIDPENIYQIRSLLKRSFKNKEYFSYVKDWFKLPSCPLGVPAKLWKTGFLPDGSELYGAFSFPTYKFSEINFNKTIEKIIKGKEQFMWGSKIDNKMINLIINIKNEFEKKNVKLILFIPPLAPKIYKKMKKSNNYEYIKQAVNALNKREIKVYNYLNPNKLGLCDCEFIDGLHHGDVVSALILLDLAKKEPVLRAYLDMFFLTKLAANRGNATVIFSQLFNKPERDFLKLGCKKKITTPLWPTPEEKKLARKLFYTGATTDHAEELRRLRKKAP